jgi:hypothetical protein
VTFSVAAQWFCVRYPAKPSRILTNRYRETLIRLEVPLAATLEVELLFR